MILGWALQFFGKNFGNEPSLASDIMLISLGISVSVLNFIIVGARPLDSYSFGSIDDSGLNDIWNLPSDDVNSNNVFEDPLPPNDSASDYTVEPLVSGGNDDSWNFASLPNCGDTESSLINDFLQARDGTSCADPNKQPESLNLPTGLFSDPLPYLNNKLQTPPVGQKDQPDQGSPNDDQYDFNAFTKNRLTTPLNYHEDDDTCPPGVYGFSVTPVCHYPNRGMVPEAESGFTLYDVTPRECRNEICPWALVAGLLMN